MTVYGTAGLKIYIGGAKTQKSTDFVLADFAAESWVEISEVESAGSVGDTSEAINFTAISDSRTRTIKGPRSAGSMDIVCGIDYSNAGQQALLAAEKTIHDYAFKVKFNDAPAAASAPVTITIASPGVVSCTGHGLVAGDSVKFTTTGALPTGLTAGQEYFVKTAVSADTFTVSETDGGTAIVTSATQSGVHTATTVPQASERYFIGKVMSQSEQYDAANSIMKLNASIGVNSNIVRVDANEA